MANNSVLQRCFEELGIPSPERSNFRRKVLDYVRNESDWGNDLSSASAEMINRVTRQCVSDGRIKNWLHLLKSTRVNLSEAELHGHVLQMVNIWVEEQTRQQSQEDQSYSEDVSTLHTNSTSSLRTPKKRKRVSSQSRSVDAANDKRNKTISQPSKASKITSFSFGKNLTIDTERNKNTENVGVPRSATIELNSQPQEVSFIGNTLRGTAVDADINGESRNDHDDDFDDLEELPELLSPRRSRTDAANNTSSDNAVNNLSATSKGKAPVRDPPGLRQLVVAETGVVSPLSPTTARAVLSTDTHGQSQDATQEIIDLSTERSNSLPQNPQGRRSFRDMRDLEAMEPEEHDSTADSGFLDQGSPFPHQILQPADGLPSPPHTTLGPQFRDAIPTGLYGLHVNQKANDAVVVGIGALNNRQHEKRDERVLDLVYEIKQYVEDCEEHSLHLAADQGSSEKERQMHRIRSSLLASLQKDIGTRISAFFDKEDGRPQKDISSYCLWS